MRKIGQWATFIVALIVINIVAYTFFAPEPEVTTVTRTEYKDTTIYVDNYKPAYVQALKDSISDMKLGINVLLEDGTKLVNENSTLRKILEYSDSTGQVDTAAIIDAVFEDYFTKYFHKDTLINDSLLFLVLNDTISRNSIISRSYEMNRVFPTKIIETTIMTTPSGFYIGGDVSSQGALGIGASYIRNKGLYTVDFNTDKVIRAGYKHKIGK